MSSLKRTSHTMFLDTIDTEKKNVWNITIQIEGTDVLYSKQVIFEGEIFHECPMVSLIMRKIFTNAWLLTLILVPNILSTTFMRMQLLVL